MSHSDGDYRGYLSLDKRRPFIYFKLISTCQTKA